MTWLQLGATAMTRQRNSGASTGTFFILSSVTTAHVPLAGNGKDVWVWGIGYGALGKLLFFVFYFLSYGSIN